jgi:hypothetical protein
MVKKLKKSSRKAMPSKIWLAVLFLFVLQIFTFAYTLSIMYKYDEYQLASFISDFEKERYEKPVVDVSENRVYIPQAKVYLPLNDTSLQMYFNLWEMPDSPLKHLYLSLSWVIGNQQKEDDASCDKMVWISTEMQEDIQFEYVGEITPTDNGLRYIYKHKACSIYDKESLDKLVDVAKSLRQY